MLASKRPLLFMCFALTAACSLHAETAQADPAQDASTAASATATEDCFSVGDVTKREACFAKESDDDIAACERTRPSACQPYKDMYAEDHQLQALNAQLLALAKKQYAGNTKDDPAYLSDLVHAAQEADRSWHAYRDADCTAEPFLQGMSRQESGNLTEACRAEKTKARISELNQLISSLKS